MLLDYYTSGDVTGTWSSSVSYVSFAWSEKEELTLSEKEKSTLLKLARETIKSHITTGKSPDMKDYEITPALKRVSGVFVTLKRDGELRGCIGSIKGEKPLYAGVIENAVYSATGDPRFTPVTAGEFNKITIELSVLSPFKKIAGPDEIITGKHGVYLKKGWHSAVFLPQVAPDQGWDRETMLSHLSMKAGLGHSDWKSGCEFSAFTALVFGE